MAHCADDVAIWVNTSLKKSTNKGVVNHVRKLYQSKLNKLAAYMKVKEKITNHEHLSHSLLMVHACYIDGVFQSKLPFGTIKYCLCLLYTSDAADER